MFEELTFNTDFIEAALFVVMIASLILSLELKKLYQISISFIVYMVAIAGIFWILGEPILSVFQLTVYAGTTGIILFASLNVFNPRHHEDPDVVIEEDEN